MLAVALYAGAFAAEFIPELAGIIVSFSVLMTIGVIKLVQGLKVKPDKHNFRPTLILKPAEAAIIAAGLSLDGVAAGFGAALGGVNAEVMLVSSLLAHMAAIPLGCTLGRHLSAKSHYNIAWVGGVVIIALAFLQLI